ncbi:response regulator [Pseudorhodoferax soli]|uniref:LuxR family two component transcriptional regulator n=1 Tax=Pseudorhodoferax soli TaxID=545864 RepID=A0A368XJJ5_9BURK|nr:response regulator transcription factor [Pseudorhodoferax soli]RCW68211.1 LuxR family two component transcriptional regulator [Pseudorhodoferax soli]
MDIPRWRVVLLEDDADMRRYFEDCVRAEPTLLLAASFGLLAPARAWFAQHQADVLLTDLALPDGHGLDLLAQVVREQPACDVLVVSVFGDEDTVLACVEAGAVGYIQKDDTPANVAQTIVGVKQGASPISPMIARKLLARLQQQGARGAAPPLPAEPQVALTPRETEVLELIARGYSYAEIARLQSVTKHTVQSHIKNLYSKLAVHSRGEAVFEASRMGLLAGARAAP